ncbi:MAG: GxxExxY protein [Candidatus Hydrogenedentota bacterium]|nr:MAG: GxxExxY protein [Candidatus Hydrogenedentota bacterium]
MSTDSSIIDQRDPDTFAVIGAAMAVHTTLGHGFLERVYQEALAIEFKNRNIPFEIEVHIPISYDGHILESSYRADFVCFSDIILELKALSVLNDSHMNQIIHYLKATGYRRGLLLNFGAERLDHKRVVYG